MVVERALGHTRRFGNVLHAGGVEAPAVQGVETRREELFANVDSRHAYNMTGRLGIVKPPSAPFGAFFVDDFSRWHWNVFRSVWLSVQDSQIPPDAHYRGISRLRGHGEVHGTGESQHRLISGKNNARCLAYPRGLRVLEQRCE